MVVTESTAKGPSVVLDDQIFEVDTKGSDNDEDGDSDPRIRTVVHRAKTIEADIQPVRATRVKPLEDNESD